MRNDYDMRCPLARAAKIIDGRWTALIMRDFLNLGPRRFQDLLDSLDGIAPNTLSGRLKALEEAGIVEREFYGQNPPRALYVLTEKGRALKPVFRAMRVWGEKFTNAP